MALVEQDRQRHGSDIVARHRRKPTVTCWPADHSILREVREDIDVEAVAQRDTKNPGGLEVLFGVVVIPGKGEGGVWSRTQERRVYDSFDASRNRSIHRRAVLVQAFACLPTPRVAPVMPISASAFMWSTPARARDPRPSWGSLTPDRPRPQDRMHRAGRAHLQPQCGRAKNRGTNHASRAMLKV